MHARKLFGMALVLAVSLVARSDASEHGRRPMKGAAFDILGAKVGASWVNAERSLPKEPYTGVQHRVIGRSVEGTDTIWMIERSTRPEGAQTFTPTGSLELFNGLGGTGLVNRKSREYAVKAPYIVGTTWTAPRWDAPGMGSGVVGMSTYTITHDEPLAWEGHTYTGVIVRETGLHVERDHWWIEGLGHMLVVSGSDTLLHRTNESMRRAPASTPPGRY